MTPDDAAKAVFMKRSLSLGVPQIRALLAMLATFKPWSFVFVVEAMRDAPTSDAGYRTRWQEALTALQSGSKIAKSVERWPAWLTRALQTATVSDFPDASILVALAMEGSDASRDALIADLERSEVVEGGLMLGDRIATFKRHRAKPLLASLLKRALEAQARLGSSAR